MASVGAQRTSTTVDPAFEAASLADIPGLQTVRFRLQSIVSTPVLSARQGIPGVVPPAGVLFYGPPDPARGAYCSALQGDLADATRGDGGPPLATCLGDPAIDPVSIEAWFVAARSQPLQARPLGLASLDDPWALPQSLLADGCFDRLVFVAPPDWEAREWRLRVGAATRGLDIESHLDELTVATNGWTGGEIAAYLDMVAERHQAGEDVTGGVLLVLLGQIEPSAIPWLMQARTWAMQLRDAARCDDLMSYLQRMRLA